MTTNDPGPELQSILESIDADDSTADADELSLSEALEAVCRRFDIKGMQFQGIQHDDGRPIGTFEWDGLVDRTRLERATRKRATALAHMLVRVGEPKDAVGFSLEVDDFETTYTWSIKHYLAKAYVDGDISTKEFDDKMDQVRRERPIAPEE